VKIRRARSREAAKGDTDFEDQPMTETVTKQPPR
jgi:hypothetical protein